MNPVDRPAKLHDTVLIPFKCAWGPSLVLLLFALVSGLVPTMQIIVVARFIDTAIRIASGMDVMGAIYTPLLLLALTIAWNFTAEGFQSFFRTRLELKVKERMRTQLTEMRAMLEYAHIENPETWDLIQRLSKDPEVKVRTAYVSLLGLLTIVARIGGFIGVLITSVWWAAVAVILFSIPMFYIAIRGGKATYDADRGVTKFRRRADYLLETLISRENVDERTMFAYSDSLSKRYIEDYEHARKVQYKATKQWFIRNKAAGMLVVLISVLVAAVLAGPVIAGDITIGLFMSIVNATTSLISAMSWGFAANMGEIAKHGEYLKDLKAFQGLSRSEGALTPPVASPPEFESLELRNVRFTYPGTDAEILKGVTLKIKKGGHYAFVGANGAGKTTITKLLTGLYGNYEGEILLNGRELKTYAAGELKSMFSIVFQDFAKYSVSVRDNIALGREGADVKGAIEKAELAETIDKLPMKEHTPLGKILPGGQDISGGEWQRVAMARAVASDAPLRILDEPTAALDPISESRVYEEYNRISHNKTTVFISHRLGSIRIADEVFVLEDGRVKENGTHDELMALGGLYHEMYESQRSWYL